MASRKGNPQSELLTVGQVAARLNVHPNTVRRWAQQGLLKSFRIGTRGDRRFDRADVERLLQPGTGELRKITRVGKEGPEKG